MFVLFCKLIYSIRMVEKLVSSFMLVQCLVHDLLNNHKLSTSDHVHRSHTKAGQKLVTSLRIHDLQPFPLRILQRITVEFPRINFNPEVHLHYNFVRGGLSARMPEREVMSSRVKLLHVLHEAVPFPYGMALRLDSLDESPALSSPKVNPVFPFGTVPK